MDQVKIRKINYDALNIYLITQRLKQFTTKKEGIDYSARLNDVLKRGKEYARNKK